MTSENIRTNSYSYWELSLACKGFLSTASHCIHIAGQNLHQRSSFSLVRWDFIIVINRFICQSSSVSCLRDIGRLSLTWSWPIIVCQMSACGWQLAVTVSLVAGQHLQLLTVLWVWPAPPQQPNWSCSRHRDRGLGLEVPWLHRCAAGILTPVGNLPISPLSIRLVWLNTTKH